MTDGSSTSSQERPPGIDTSKAHAARIWNYLLGGKDNYPVDRDAAEQFIAVMPSVIDLARADRGFLGRAVRYLAGEAGIRQFLDIGTGLPTASNTHEVAQTIAPDCRIVYADNDPLVLVHARARRGLVFTLAARPQPARRPGRGGSLRWCRAKALTSTPIPLLSWVGAGGRLRAADCAGGRLVTAHTVTSCARCIRVIGRSAGRL